jgi:hypothetical protein
MGKIDKIIKYFRSIDEEVSPVVPTNSVGPTGITSKGNPIAGFEPVMGFRRRKKTKDLDYRSVPKNYRRWVKDITK